MTEEGGKAVFRLRSPVFSLKAISKCLQFDKEPAAKLASFYQFDRSNIATALNQVYARHGF
jgi:hypothetical protein